MERSHGSGILLRSLERKSAKPGFYIASGALPTHMLHRPDRQKHEDRVRSKLTHIWVAPMPKGADCGHRHKFNRNIRRQHHAVGFRQKRKPTSPFGPITYHRRTTERSGSVMEAEQHEVLCRAPFPVPSSVGAC